MGMAVGSSGGGGGRRGRRGRRGGAQPMSEINVTPLVDVMLVLLIVFMVAAPLLTAGVPLDLPQSAAKELNTESNPITVSVTADGAIFLGENPSSVDEIVAGVAELITAGADERILLRGDTSVGYGDVMEIMGLLSRAGHTKIGLITEQAQGQ